MAVRDGAITFESLKIAFWRGVAIGSGVTFIVCVISLYLGRVCNESNLYKMW